MPTVWHSTGRMFFATAISDIRTARNGGMPCSTISGSGTIHNANTPAKINIITRTTGQSEGCIPARVMIVKP